MRNKKGTLAPFLFLFLVSCAEYSPWVTDHIDTGNQTYNSAKLSCLTRDPVNGIDLEMLLVEGHIHTHLQVHSHSIPPFQGNFKEALVSIAVDNQTFTYACPRHEGGQRVRLTEQLQAHLLNALAAKKTVKIQLEGYQAVISAKHFLTQYKRLQITPYRNPFQLPFNL